MPHEGGQKGGYGGKSYGKGYAKGSYGKAYGKGYENNKGSTKGGYGSYGGKSYGKGGKNGEYGKGWNDKGKGKGFQGTCWKYGVVGHRANDCNGMEVGAVLNFPGFEEETVIGGLWEVGHVEVERKTGLDGSVKMHGCRNPVTRKKRSETKTQNSFDVLAEDMVEIGVVSHDGVQDTFGQITIDSGAAESVMPKNFLPGLAIEPASGMKGQAKYVAANGSRMGNYGQKKVPFRTNMGGSKQAITFQVTDVTKPLAAVSRIVEKGNVCSLARRRKITSSEIRPGVKFRFGRSAARTSSTCSTTSRRFSPGRPSERGATTRNGRGAAFR